VQAVLAKEIGQRLQPVRELLDRRAVLDEARRVNSRIICSTLTLA
jgi:hypothetical protein